MKRVQIALIVLASVALIYVVYSYNQRSKASVAAEAYKNYEHFSDGVAAAEAVESNEQQMQSEEPEQGGADMEQVVQQQVQQQMPEMNGVPTASESNGNEVYRTVANYNEAADPTGLQNNQVPNDCYPKDQLSPSELLPTDANSKWSQVNPTGQGDLVDQNFINAGQHIGVNTVGQSMRNPNYQLRSEPANPQEKVSPWMQSTIGPDVSRRSLEIGN